MQSITLKLRKLTKRTAQYPQRQGGSECLFAHTGSPELSWIKGELNELLLLFLSIPRLTGYGVLGAICRTLIDYILLFTF